MQVINTVRRRWRALAQQPEAGSAAMELTLITPFFILLLLIIVGIGRMVDAHIQVGDAAAAAARAATLAPNPAAARSAAATAAADSLSQAGITCQTFSVDASVGSLAPGSTVTVRVSCTVGLADVGHMNLPGSRTETASFASVVDRYRSQDGNTP